MAGGVAAAVTTPLDVAKVSLRGDTVEGTELIDCVRRRRCYRREEVIMILGYDKHEVWRRHYGSFEIVMDGED